jgi:Flp pilus assembly protein TadG
MLGSTRSILRRLAAESRGAEIAEAAAVLPLMFMILLGIFWFGQAFSIYGAITRAAQEGARAGAVPNCTTCTASTPAQDVTNAVNAVTTALVASKLDPTLTRVPVPAVVLPSCGASWTSASTTIYVQAPVWLKTSGSAAGVCGLSVSFQYPFQFWLPFTSLNKQQIWMTASARVRLETQ